MEPIFIRQTNMKIILFTRSFALMAAFLLSVMGLMAQVNVTIHKSCTDSVAFVRESSDRYPGGWNFDLVGLNFSASSKKHQKKKIRSSLILLGGWGFGFCDAVHSDAAVRVDMGRSFHFCIEDLVAYRKRLWERGALQAGMGIDLRNYRMTGHQRFVVDPSSKMITVGDYPEGAVPGTSKIRTFSTTFSVKYLQQLGRRFRLALGPELSVVPDRAKRHHIHTTYTLERKEQEETFKGIRTNKVGFSLVGVLSYKSMLGIYAKYGLSDVLNTSFGPQFRNLSVGVMVFGI